jgi:hypothetical protein
MGSVTRGKTIGQTVQLVEDIGVDPMVSSLQCDFPLCEADYVRLTRPRSVVRSAAYTFLLLSAGWGISLVAKLMSTWFSHTVVSVQAWEYCAVVIGMAVAIILFAISAHVPNEKKMDLHFKSHPRKTVVTRR